MDAADQVTSLGADHRAARASRFTFELCAAVLARHLDVGIADINGQSSPVAAPVAVRPRDGMRLLTAEEVASRLGVQTSWVSKAARADRIPHVCVGRYRRFRWPDIEAWLEDQRRGS